MRFQRSKIGLDDFELLTIIGGEVKSSWHVSHFFFLAFHLWEQLLVFSIIRSHWSCICNEKAEEIGNAQEKPRNCAWISAFVIYRFLANLVAVVLNLIIPVESLIIKITFLGGTYES